MDEFSVLIGGKAGEGINQSGSLLAHIINQFGYQIYTYLDYPSLIRGGHNFSIVRASSEKIETHQIKIDFLLALNQDTINFHKHRLKKNSIVVYDSDTVKPQDVSAINQLIGIPLSKIAKEENATIIMRNSCIIGSFSKTVGIGWDDVERIFKKHIPKEIDINLRVAKRGFDQTQQFIKIEQVSNSVFPILTGNEAVGLGLIEGGLNAYIAYPMTPSSSLLHFLANVASEFQLKVIHPESEIAVILMALGFAYAGQKTVVGTSGGGFCLMAEGLSLAGIVEVPVVFVICQRPGPSTGVPTYTAQADLQFVLSAGQGEFVRFVVAPGDAEQAFFWSALSLNIAWKYQIPSIILSDKALSEGAYSFNRDAIEEIPKLDTSLWNRKGAYKRYLDTETGISPLTFVPDREAVIKVNSYEHDEYGLTSEAPQEITRMTNKRLRKEKYLAKEIDNYKPVQTFGNISSPVALLCWGSNKGVCTEVAKKLNLRVIQPVVLSPFPIAQFKESIKGVKRIISVENNATAQIVTLLNRYGLDVDEKILKYDGRPYTLDVLQEQLKKVI